MKLDLLSKIVLANLCMLFFSLFIPISYNKSIQEFLGPATFLYGVIYGFEIYIVLENFFNLKILLASEIANLLSIFYFARILNGKAFEEITQGLENYIMTVIDHSLIKHASATNKEFFTIFDPMIHLKDLKGEQKTAADNINKKFYHLSDSRNQIGQVAKRDVAFAEWFMMILLACIMIVILFLDRQNDLLSKVATGIFAGTIVGTLLLLDEIDSNRFQEDNLEYEGFNQALEAMGRIPYYPEFALKNHRVKRPKNKPYRVGKFPHYPSLVHREVDIIDS